MQPPMEVARLSTSTPGRALTPHTRTATNLNHDFAATRIVAEDQPDTQGDMMATEETQPNSEDQPASPEATMSEQEARFDSGGQRATPADIMPRTSEADPDAPGATASAGEPQTDSPEVTTITEEPQSEQIDQPAPVTYRPVSKLTSRILAVSAVLITALLAALTVAAYTENKVEVTNVVQTSAPRNANLWGYCYEDSAEDGYRISISAFSGGIEHTVAEGTYTAEAAASLGVSIADYYRMPFLFFGASSVDCAHLSGWGSLDQLSKGSDQLSEGGTECRSVSNWIKADGTVESMNC